MTVLDLCDDVIVTRLRGHSVGLLSIDDVSADEPVPVPFRVSGTDVLCLVPRWTNLSAAFEQRTEWNALLAVAESRADGEHWLRCYGPARETSAAWPGFKPVGAHAAPLHQGYRVIEISLHFLETKFPKLRQATAVDHQTLAI